MTIASVSGIDVGNLVIAPSAQPKDAAAVAQELEATFFRLLLQASGLFAQSGAPGGAGVWQDLFTQQLAQELAAQHRLGVGQLVLQELNREGGQ